MPRFPETPLNNSGVAVTHLVLWPKATVKITFHDHYMGFNVS